MLISGLPCILENLEYNKLIFQVLEISLNLTKSGNVLEIILPGKKIPLRTKKPVNKYYACRRKLQL